MIIVSIPMATRLCYGAPMLKGLKNETRIWFRDALSESEIKSLGSHFPQEEQGLRYKLSSKIVSELKRTAFFTEISKCHSKLRIVRVTSFNKTKDRTWSLPWHQDRVIQVKARHDVEGFKNWTKKADVWHCEAPEAVLRNMVFLRVNIDDNTYANGVMEIANRKLGVIDARNVAAAVQASPLEKCIANAGDVLALRFLTLHRSNIASEPVSRRVLRLDLAFDDLPKPLEWCL